MKKLLAIVVLGLLFSGNANADEKIYCLNLKGEYRGGDYSDQVHSAHSFNKSSVKKCKDRNKPLMFSSASIKRNLIEISKEFYDSSNFQNTFPKLIRAKKLKQVAVKYGVKLSSSSSSILTCYDNVDFSWSVPDGGNYAKFKFTSSSEKPINIFKIIIKTRDKITVLEQNVSVNLKPFGLGSSSVYIGDRNKDAIKKGNYRCSFGLKSKTVSTSKKSNKNSDGWFRWWYILVGLGILGFLGYVAEGSPKSNKTRSASARTSKENIIEIVWEGKETMSKTFWLYCILATFVVSFISGLLLASLGVMIFIAPVIMIIWSNTGLWRSSEIYKNEKLNNKQTYGWATAAKTYVVINYITTLSQIGLSLNS